MLPYAYHSRRLQDAFGTCSRSVFVFSANKFGVTWRKSRRARYLLARVPTRRDRSYGLLAHIASARGQTRA